jgi:hypothetical protein
MRGVACDCEGSKLGLPERSADPLQRPVNLVAGYHKWWGNTDRVSMGILGKDASALQRLTVATCVAVSASSSQHYLASPRRRIMGA